MGVRTYSQGEGEKMLRDAAEKHEVAFFPFAAATHSRRRLIDFPRLAELSKGNQYAIQYRSEMGLLECNTNLLGHRDIIIQYLVVGM